jgi:hypothetical protein
LHHTGRWVFARVTSCTRDYCSTASSIHVRMRVYTYTQSDGVWQIFYTTPLADPSSPSDIRNVWLKKKKHTPGGGGCIGRNGRVWVDLHRRCPMIKTRDFYFFIYIFFFLYLLLRDASAAVRPCTRTIEFLPIESRRSPRTVAARNSKPTRQHSNAYRVRNNGYNWFIIITLAPYHYYYWSTPVCYGRTVIITITNEFCSHFCLQSRPCLPPVNPATTVFPTDGTDQHDIIVVQPNTFVRIQSVRISTHENFWGSQGWSVLGPVYLHAFADMYILLLQILVRSKYSIKGWYDGPSRKYGPPGSSSPCPTLTPALTQTDQLTPSEHST